MYREKGESKGVLKGAVMYWEGCISGAHIASQACAKDYTVVYGDYREIANAMTVLDACAVHGL